MGLSDRDDEMSTSCEHVKELLPWYLNRTLSVTESSLVAEHLAECPECRDELEATSRVAWIHERHIPAGALTDYAFGTNLTGRERTVLERHLAHCERCREDLATAQEVAEVRLELAPPSGGPAWWPLAMAASLAILVLGAGLWWSSVAVQEPAPTGNVAVVELLPASFGVRGATDDAGVPAGGATTLVLVTDLALKGEMYRARLVSAGEETLWEVTALRPADDGTFAFHLPPGVPLPDGSSVLLEIEEGGEWRTLETYPVGR